MTSFVTEQNPDGKKKKSCCISAAKTNLKTKTCCTFNPDTFEAVLTLTGSWMTLQVINSEFII